MNQQLQMSIKAFTGKLSQPFSWPSRAQLEGFPERDAHEADLSEGFEAWPHPQSSQAMLIWEEGAAKGHAYDLIKVAAGTHACLA